jgi:hypothetical protein
MKSKVTYLIALAFVFAAYCGMAQKPGHTSGSSTPSYSKGGGGNASPSPKPTYSQPSRPQPAQSQPSPKQTYSQPSHSQPAQSQPSPKQTYSQPSHSQPAQSQPSSKPTYSQPTPRPSYNDSRPTQSQPTYSQPTPRPSYNDSRPTQSQPTYSQPTPRPSYNDSRPTQSQPTYSQPTPRPVHTDARPNPVGSNVESQPGSAPKPNYATRPVTVNGGNTDGAVRPTTETLDPRVGAYTGVRPTVSTDSRPTLNGSPSNFSDPTANGPDDNPAEGNDGAGGEVYSVTVCVDGNTLSVPSNQLQSYLSQGGVAGPCNGGGTGGNGPIGNGNPVGSGGIDPIDHPTTGGVIGNGNPVGNNGTPADPTDLHPHGGGHGHNNGGGNGGGSNGGWNGQGALSGPGCVTGTTNYGYGGGYYNSGYTNTGCGSCSNSWYVGGGCGHSAYGGFCGGCSGNNYYYTTNYMNNCNSYYGYGYYYPASYNYGYCYTGLYSGISYTVIYPWVPKSYKLQSFVPAENRRVVILDSRNGKRHWRIVEERVWMPERIIWDNGQQVKQDGYYTWRVVEKVKYRHKKRNCRICDPKSAR